MKLNKKFAIDMDKELIRACEDLLIISQRAKKIGWDSISGRTYHRIVYLLKVLYTFCHDSENIFSMYHFSISTFGPYSELVDRGMVFMLSSGWFSEDKNGCIESNDNKKLETADPVKMAWIDTILLILGKYGEEKVFGFVVNDPLYEEYAKSNLTRELDTSEDNTTMKVLDEFKASFEETLQDTSSISKEEYIKLYFDYVFSRIIGER